MGRALRIAVGLFGGLVLVAAVAGSRARVRIAEVQREDPADRPIWIGSATVFDGESVRRGQDVLIRGPIIASVTPAGQEPPPASALRIDGSGRTLLPGLIDSHAHLLTAGGPPWRFYLPDVPAHARALLCAGVTSALVAVSGDDEDKLAARAEAGQALAPHLFRAGPGLTAPQGHPIPFIRALVPWPLSSLIVRAQPTVGAPEEAPAAVARIAQRHRPPFLKIFYDAIPEGAPRLSRETLRAVVKAAKQSGLRPIVHIGSSEDMLAAAEAGAALLMHPPSKDLLSDAQIERLKELGVPFVTTLRTLLAAEEVAATGGSLLERECIDGRVLAALASPPPGWELKGFEGMQREFPRAARRMQDNVRRLVLAGVPFFVGTDAGVFGVLPGASLHGELQALGRLGVPALALLRAATSAPAAFLDPGRSFGKVEAGQRADLLLVRGDPTADLTALSQIEQVFLSGARLTRRPL
jgi:imidazolonepropionase-like amidohydrolase